VTMSHPLLLAPALVTALALAACGGNDLAAPATSTPSTSPERPRAQTAETTPVPRSTPQSNGVEGTVVRFTADGTSVDVTIGRDNVATRDFVSMLPLTLRLEEFAGREKIADLPRRLDVDGAPGSDPENGDLIYFVPWGNLGFYYNTEGIGFSDETINLGTYMASRQQLERLENRDVTVEVVR
jgi:hypothetical protein